MNQDWQSPAFREEIRNKMANATEGPIENHPFRPLHVSWEEKIFNRSNSAEEYCKFVDKLLKRLHQKIMGNQGENSLTWGSSCRI